MLCTLLEVPETEDDWGRFAWHNLDQINLIQQAILQQYGLEVTSYILFPLPLDNPSQWLQNNQSAHNDFNTALGLQSHNIEDLDFNNPDEVASWINLNYQELFDASEMLKI